MTVPTRAQRTDQPGVAFVAPSTTATRPGASSRLRPGRSNAHPWSCLPAFTGGSIVVDSITDYRPTDLRRHLPTFTAFLRETNTIAYLLLHPTARPDAVVHARGRFATASSAAS